NFLLDGLLLVEPQPDAEGPAVGQAELPALVGVVARLAEFVLDVVQADALIVAFDGEDFAQDPLEPGPWSLLGEGVQLQETFVRAGLDVGQRGHVEGVAVLAEVSDLLMLDNTLSRDGHSSCSSLKRPQDAPASRRRQAVCPRRCGGAPVC